MKKRTTLALLAATAAALAYRPSREWIGDAMIDAGIRLAYGADPAPTPEQLDRMRREIAEAIAAECGRHPHPATGRNGHAGGASSGQSI